MGSQFWWFYDVAAAAILLICIFVGSRKGVMKSAFAFVGLIIAAILSYAVSGAVSETISGNMVSESNAKKIASNIDSETFTDMYADYLTSMGYSIKVDKNKLGKALDSKENIDEAVVKYINNINGHAVDEKEVVFEKVREGYAVVISDIISRSLNKYASETAAEIIRNDSSGMAELIPLLRNSDNIHPAALYIAKNYASPAYYVIGRLAAFLIVFCVAAFIIVCSVNAFFGRKEVEAIGVSSHVMGGVFGILSAAVLIFAVAAGIRLSAVLGNDAMLFFNNDAVSKSYVFRYFYELVMKM